MGEVETVELFRPVGPKELARIRESGFRAFPRRLHYQPIFYPVMNEEYARKIARDWNATREDTGYRGYVTRFRVKADYLARFPVQTVGASWHQELWVPAEELDQFQTVSRDTDWYIRSRPRFTVAPAGRRAMSWPMLTPDLDAVATFVPVAPATAWTASSAAAATALVPVARTSNRSVIPVSWVNVASLPVPNKPTTVASATVVVIDGAVTLADDAFAWPPCVSMGLIGSMPE